ncbi:MAG: DinB family protein [Streptosporangiaceae bacterium]
MPAANAEWTAPEYPRPDEPFTGPERPMLDAFLDRYRASLLMRCTGLTGAQLAVRSVPPSSLLLLGIVRHLTDVERTYFRRRWGGQDIASYYATQDRPDGAFDDTDPAEAQRDLERLVAEQDLARQAVAGVPLDAIFVSERWGAMSLRWALTHLIAEYAAHAGQADLIRERIDGRAGWSG